MLNLDKFSSENLLLTSLTISKASTLFTSLSLSPKGKYLKNILFSLFGLGKVNKE